MRYALTGCLLLLLAAWPSLAQSNEIVLSGNTNEESPTRLPAFGSTPSMCELSQDAEPYFERLFFSDTGGEHQFDVTEPVSTMPGTDDTILILYEGEFDPAAACTNFVAVGNDPPGSGLTQTISGNQQYTLVTAGFFGTEDDGTITATGPQGSTLSQGSIPVELVALNVVHDGRDAVLSWQTASETNNAGFEVEHRVGDAGDFRKAAFVQGSGTTAEPRTYGARIRELGPGTHAFRLKQIDLDDAFEYSPVVELTVAMTERFVLEPAYPNPFVGRATVRFGVREAEPVRVDVYNTLGQHVQVLYEGIPAPGAMRTLHLDGSRLASGLYFVRLSGRGGMATRRVTLIK